MKVRHLALCALAALLPALAAAQEAHSTKWVNLRAGPARDYPLVASYGPGTPLLVQGCTDGYGWCDVVGPGDARGWVYAGNLAYPYQNGDVPVLSYGPQLGFPIVVFSIGSYWGQYYRNRPWFGNQGRWLNHRPPPRPILPAAGAAPGPPVDPAAGRRQAARHRSAARRLAPPGMGGGDGHHGAGGGAAGHPAQAAAGRPAMGGGRPARAAGGRPGGRLEASRARAAASQAAGRRTRPR